MMTLILLFMSIVLAEDCSWTGTWDIGDNGPLMLQQVSNAVTGIYAQGDGKLQGTVSASKVTGTFTRGGFTGDCELEMSNDCTLTGRYRITTAGYSQEWKTDWFEVGRRISYTSDVERSPGQVDSEKCRKAGGYWKLINGEIITILKNYPAEEYTGNYIDTYDWHGGLTDDLDGEIRVTDDAINKYDETWNSHIEYTVKWDSPPSVLYPGYELNIPLSIVASKSCTDPSQVNFDGRNWMLFWCSGFDSGLQPIGTEAYGGEGSSFYFPEQSFNGPGPFSGTRIFHWHGDRVNQCGPTSHSGPESMDGVQSIGFGSQDARGAKRALKMRLPYGPVIMYTYSWVTDCNTSQEGGDT